MERYRRNKPSSNRSGLSQTQESSDAEYSDFPPIRQRESSPPAPAAGVRSQGRPQPINVSSEEEPSPLRSRRPASAGLGSNNLANFEGKASLAKRAKPAQSQKPLSGMRPPGSEDVENDRPAKKRRLGSSDEAHMRWVREEITAIREGVEKSAVEAREGRRALNNALQELIYEVQRRLSVRRPAARHQPTGPRTSPPHLTYPFSHRPDASTKSNGAHQERVACAWRARRFPRPPLARGLHRTSGLAAGIRSRRLAAGGDGPDCRPLREYRPEIRRLLAIARAGPQPRRQRAPSEARAAMKNPFSPGARRLSKPFAGLSTHSQLLRTRFDARCLPRSRSAAHASARALLGTPALCAAAPRRALTVGLARCGSLKASSAADPTASTGPEVPPDDASGLRALYAAGRGLHARLALSAYSAPGRREGQEPRAGAD
ncbi:hypothetical protein HYPSUDRAFT_202861 [Hypholoma sublateritium FD-334 SS-4]|uniref:Uncharacterized protein n=1 Tax=Hypholoma sublateritium (strain FD-334 SS-4) TaxID=945553 RepID=A0A0D2MD94_HYPSF|nr:hypothetical protein HYPSUDRAFT_202861 [Hypholoma sublateritium FD-334 SS-4]